MSFNLDEYVDVAERITLFYEKFPDGRLTRLGEPKVMEVGGKLFVQYTARAYRTADDPIPAIGTAWEPFPGPTQFTRDSELMNAETAAWGRAIIAAGIGSKKIASRQEVRNRQPKAADDPTPKAAPGTRRVLSKAQLEKVLGAVNAAGVTAGEWTTYRDALGASSNEALTAMHARTIRAWLDSRRGSDVPSDAPVIEAMDESDMPWATAQP